MIVDSVFFFFCFYSRRRESSDRRTVPGTIGTASAVAAHEVTDAEEAQLLLAGLPAPDAGDSSAEEHVVKLEGANL